MRMLYGLDRLPGTLSADDPRLPAVELGAAPLRLNTVPLPPDAWGTGAADHAARMAALRTWLLASCGDYNEASRRGVTRYLDAVAAHVARHRDVLSRRSGAVPRAVSHARLVLVGVRPLPRAWWRRDGAWVRADLAFWDGGDGRSEARRGISPPATFPSRSSTSGRRDPAGQPIPALPPRGCAGFAQTVVSMIYSPPTKRSTA